MATTLRFERPGSRLDLPQVTIPMNAGWTLLDVDHRALVDFGGLRINGATLKDPTQQEALACVVYAAARYSDIGEELDALVREETRDDKLQIFADDRDKRADIPERRTLESALYGAELRLFFFSEMFLALYQGRPIELEGARSAKLELKSQFNTGTKRDVLVQ